MKALSDLLHEICPPDEAARRAARVRWDDGTGSLTYRGDEIGGLNRTNAAARARVVGR